MYQYLKNCMFVSGLFILNLACPLVGHEVRLDRTSENEMDFIVYCMKEHYKLLEPKANIINVINQNRELHMMAAAVNENSEPNSIEANESRRTFYLLDRDLAILHRYLVGPITEMYNKLQRKIKLQIEQPISLSAKISLEEISKLLYTDILEMQSLG